MDNERLKKLLDTDIKLKEKADTSRIAWYRQIAFLTSTLLGILIALGNKNFDNHIYHLCLACSIFLLSIGCITALILIHSLEVRKTQKDANEYRRKFQESLHSGDPFASFDEYRPCWCKWVEMLSYGSMGLAFLILGVSSFICV
ncbi:hypothetical protein [Parabacteroides pacaensis]|uniref:hypothetical protein n=1 Tax=Parabacteroides pacaensis TaxID=2086575 RepID=UPI000D1011AA|nr:hypothetical protein [Parabacteroides pacaensis]